MVHPVTSSSFFAAARYSSTRNENASESVRFCGWMNDTSGMSFTPDRHAALMPRNVSHSIGITAHVRPSYTPVIPYSIQERMMEQVKIGLYFPATDGVICPPHRPMGIIPPACTSSSGVYTGKQPTTFFPADRYFSICFRGFPDTSASSSSIALISDIIPPPPSSFSHP